MSDSNTPRTVAATEAFSVDELRALAARIADSGVLGRSPHYQSLLDYLVECAIDGKTPKEIDLAVEGLGRGDDYDVSADSAVRVYVHQLRKKLEAYYEQYAPQATARLVIPKGQYRLAVMAVQPVRPSRLSPVAMLRGFARQFFQFNLNTALLSAAVMLLLMNLVIMMNQPVGTREFEYEALAQHPVWRQVLGDNKPVLLVMGDYYIFGELNANGNVARMVREFNVNSASDLEELRFSDIKAAEHYLDLDLSYMPEGSAFALARIVPILQEAGKPVNITMMSDLSTADIRSNHIVYIGYISALDKLRDLTFAGSALDIGRSYDELLNLDTLEYYTSDAGLPEQGKPFHDYGLFSTYPASFDTQVILVTGMRDAGLMHTAQALSDMRSLNELVASIEHDTDEALASFEALYEVYGVDRLNFDANLVYSGQMDASRIWRGAPETGAGIN